MAGRIPDPVHPDTPGLPRPGVQPEHAALSGRLRGGLARRLKNGQLRCVAVLADRSRLGLSGLREMRSRPTRPCAAADVSEALVGGVQRAVRRILSWRRRAALEGGGRRAVVSRGRHKVKMGRTVRLGRDTFVSWRLFSRDDDTHGGGGGLCVDTPGQSFVGCGQESSPGSMTRRRG